MSNVEVKEGSDIEICVSWVDATDGGVPPRAIKAGNACYVIRAEHNDEYIPGKLVVGHECVYVSYGGEEISKSEYQVPSYIMLTYFMVEI